MRVFVILGLGLLAGAGLYVYQDKQPAPIQKLKPLPPPPTPPPPPTLSQADLNRAVANTAHYTTTMRIAALSKLAMNSNPGIDNVLVERLRSDTEFTIRIQILDLLASRHKRGDEKQEDRRNTARILQGMRDTNRYVRIAALQAIQRVNGRSAANPLTKFLRDTDVEVRKGIIRTIAFLVGSGSETNRLVRASYKLPSQYEAIYQKALANAAKAQTSAP